MFAVFRGRGYDFRVDGRRGAIAGYTIGGLAGFAVFCFVVWLVLKRRSH